MALTRRSALKVGTGALTAAAFPGLALGQEIPPELTAEEAIALFSNGVAPVDGVFDLVLPEIAEDGYKVSVEIEAPGAEALLLVAPANPIPPVLAVKFGPLAARNHVESRVRLADTQDVMAFARMPDGTVLTTSRRVLVLVGGCA